MGQDLLFLSTRNMRALPGHFPENAVKVDFELRPQSYAMPTSMMWSQAGSCIILATSLIRYSLMKSLKFFPSAKLMALKPMVLLRSAGLLRQTSRRSIFSRGTGGTK